MRNSVLTLPTGLSPSMAFRSRKLKLINLGIYLTTSLTSFQKQIRFALYPFRSLLLRVSLFYFLFLQVLRCFNSLRVFVSRHFLAKKLSHSEISGSILACSSPELIAACHVLRQNSNQAIHLLVCLVKSTPILYLLHLILSASSNKFLC